MEIQEIKIENYIVYVIKNFIDKINNSQEIYDELVSGYHYWRFKKIYDCDGSVWHNYMIKNTNYKNFYDLLYYKFVYLVSKKFNGLKIHETNKPDVHAYLNNKDFYTNCIHNHATTAVVNAVYYFNVPENSESKLFFYNNDGISIGSFQPQTNDLIMFSCNLNHAVQQSASKEYRISLNLELICNNDLLSHFEVNHELLPHNTNKVS